MWASRYPRVFLHDQNRRIDEKFHTRINVMRLIWMSSLNSDGVVNGDVLLFTFHFLVHWLSNVSGSDRHLRQFWWRWSIGQEPNIIDLAFLLAKCDYPPEGIFIFFTRTTVLAHSDENILKWLLVVLFVIWSMLQGILIDLISLSLVFIWSCSFPNHFRVTWNQLTVFIFCQSLSVATGLPSSFLYSQVKQ